MHPTIKPPTPWFSAPHSGTTDTVGQSVLLSQQVFRTTSGSVFRCNLHNTNFDVNKLLCCQCSQGNAHIVEARSLKARSLRAEAAHLQRDILNLSPVGDDFAGCSYIADIKCARRDAPYNYQSFPSDEKLTQLAQQNQVVCAYQLLDGKECGEQIILSELPDHHRLLHDCNFQPIPPASRDTASSTSTRFQSRELFGMTGAGASVSDVRRPPSDIGPGVDAVNPREVLAAQQFNEVLSPQQFAFVRTYVETSNGINKKDIEDNKKGIGDTKKCIDGNKANIAELITQMGTLVRITEQLENATAKLTAEVTSQGNYIERLERRVQFGHTNGTLLWKIPDFKKAIEEARLHRDKVSFQSNSFYSHTGCKLCAKIYPNGDGFAERKQVSVFLVILKTEMDNFIRWPFVEKVTMASIGSGGQVLYQDSFAPDPASSSFQQPRRNYNIASGIPCFLPLADIENFLVDGALHLKITVGEQE